MGGEKAAKKDAIRPFRANVSESDVTDLRERLAATMAHRELVSDRSQGVQLATLQGSPATGRPSTSWRKCETRLNALPQFTTEIDGVEIHFIHVRSRHENALPLIMTHGWPGSVIELLETIGPLTDPTAHGGRRRPPPGAAVPARLRLLQRANRSRLGRQPHGTRVGGADEPPRLLPLRRSGRRRGALVTDLMGRQAVEGLVGYHLNLLTAVLAIGDHLPESEQERAAPRRSRRSGRRASVTSSKWPRPQTIGYALLDSPVALAAWLLDHGTDSYYKISRAFVGGEPVGGLTRESIIDNITLYWFTGTAASARSYWEDARALAAALASGQPPPPVTVPVGFTTFPGEIWASPRSWVEAVYPDLACQRGRPRRTLRAWEEPALFASELRGAFKSLR